VKDECVGVGVVQPLARRAGLNDHERAVQGTVPLGRIAEHHGRVALDDDDRLLLAVLEMQPA